MENRRPLTSREHPLSKKIAQWIAKRAFPTPNQISVMSIAFAIIGAVLLVRSHHWLALLFTALMVQCRLLCNLFDGMVAMECGKKSADGVLYNEIPDRIADSFFIVAVGYAIDVAWLGWLIALLAMMTAYLRLFGGSLGFQQKFTGPMAKQHRMALLTLMCIVGAVESYFFQTQISLLIGLVVMLLGTALTCVIRVKEVREQLIHRE